MTGQELIDECRTRLRDTGEPQFWTDASILTYLNQAERIFAERTYVLIDYSSYTVAVTTASTTYPIDADILQVLAVQEAASEVVLRRLNNNYALVYTTSTGTPGYYYVGSTKPITLGVFPKPDASYTLNLIAAIKPTAEFTVGTSPEIPSQYHLDLVHYAVATCLSHAEVDAYDPAVAKKAEDNWGIALRDAKRDVYRIQFGPDTFATGINWTGGHQ